jgi:beta-lactamase class A
VLAERLRAVVDEAVSRKVASRVGVAVYDLGNGQAVGLNADRIFKPASVIKLAVLVGAFRARGGMRPEQFERLRPSMQRMITISDNPSTRQLVRRLGPRHVNAAIRELGLQRFRVGETGSRSWVLQGSQATPADTALLLAKLARREVVSPRASEEMLALLGAQLKRRRIPAGLPPAPDLWVGNKTGTLNGTVNDAGIVLQPRSGIGYTLVVFTAGARSESAGEKLIADLSAVVYGYMASRARGS